MKKGFSYSSLKKIVVVLAVLFTFVLSNVNKTEASICVNQIVGCDSFINDTNKDTADSLLQIEKIRNASEKNLTEYVNKVEDEINKNIEDNFKSSEDVKFLTQNLNNVIDKNNFNKTFDVLIKIFITGKTNSIVGALGSGIANMGTGQEGAILSMDDAVEPGIVYANKAFLKTKYEDLLKYLNDKENSSNPEIKNSVSQSLKKILGDEISDLTKQELIFKTTSGTGSSQDIKGVEYLLKETGDNKKEYTVILGFDPMSGPTSEFTEGIFNISLRYPDSGLQVGESIPDPKGQGGPQITQGSFCDASNQSFWDIVNSSSCSVTAYLINMTLSALNSFFGFILTWILSLFDWSVNFGITNFTALLDSSGAYDIYQKVILSLVVSLVLPFIFYLIIRSLLDNDLEIVKKILPKLLFVALFVYFSFTMAGLLVDQANIFSLKIYSTLNKTTQPLSETIKRVLLGNGSDFTIAPNIPAPGSMNSVPVYLIQVIITGAAVLVFLQATILIFSRAIVLLLCLIFSPIMVLPEGKGIPKQVSKYKELVMENFMNNTLLAPIFMFLVLIAIQIGQVGNNLITSSAIGKVTIEGAPSTTFLASAISGVISVVVLMLAISAAKKMSGSIGTTISGKISAFTGKLAFGGLSMAAKGGVNAVTNSDRFKGWVAKGGRSGRVAYNLANNLKGQTFDLRNNSTFKKATGSSFGTGVNSSAEQTYHQKFDKERRYYNTLTEEGKVRHINRLTNSLSTPNERHIARDLITGKSLSFSKRLDTYNKDSEDFDKANQVTDTNKRLGALYTELDNHFEINGAGKEYFTKEISKDENKSFKENLVKANNEKDEGKRKTEVLRVIKDFEDKKQAETVKQEQGEKKSNLSESPKKNLTGINPKTSTSTTPSLSSNRTLNIASSKNNLAEIDTELRKIEEELNKSDLSKLEKATLEDKFNSLEQEKKALDKKFTEIPKEKIAIGKLDTRLRELEIKLRDSTTLKSTRDTLEKEFNSLEQEKKKIQNLNTELITQKETYAKALTKASSPLISIFKKNKTKKTTKNPNQAA